MTEIRLHGRGGAGVAISADMLVGCFVNEGKYAAGFPLFAGERRGAPLSAFVRFDDDPIRIKTLVYSPDCLIVADASQLSWPETCTGLKPNAIIILNDRDFPQNSPHKNLKTIAVVNATQVALAELGRPITNSCMLGAFAAATQWISLESVCLALEQQFQGDLLKRNIRCAERGFQEIQIKKW